MADMTAMADILNDDPANAAPVQSNFQIIEAYINGSELIRADGTKAMTADLDMGGYGFTNVSLTNIVPPGVIQDYAGNTVPTGWLLCDGSTVSRTTYADLFAAIGVLWNTGGEAGTDFRLPDLEGLVTVGFGASPYDTVGGTGGSADAVVVEHTHTSPAHVHDIGHGHADTLAAPAHTHSIAHTHSYDYRNTTPTDQVGTGGTFRNLSVGSSTTGGSSAANSGGASATALTGSVTDHAGNSGAFNGDANVGTTGVSATNANYPPYAVVKKIIKT